MIETCPHSGFCGGCSWQGTPYEEQLRQKGLEAERLLGKYGEFTGITGSPSLYAYRNKMEYTFGDFVKDGEMTLGMHRKKSFMSILTVDQCQLVPMDFNVILSATLQFCRERGYDYYHRKTHKGLMRNLVIRCGIHTEELLVNIVTSSQRDFAAGAYLDMLLALPLQKQIVSVSHTLTDRVADAVYPDEVRLLYGREYYTETMLGLTFHVGAFSFFQTNVAAVERLYQEAIGMIDDVAGKTVIDLYCGTGTITQVLARRAKKAVGIELVEEAVEGARRTAALNGIENCEFLAGDVYEVLAGVTEKPDVIVVDPPRAGIMPKALDRILAYGVPQLLYISCNPKTMAPNLEYLTYYGYRAGQIKAFDNFPFTSHVETVVCLSRK